MTTEKIMALLITILGVFMVIKFPHVGRKTIQQRRKLNRILPFPQPDKDFDRFSVFIAQFLCLMVGIIFVLAGLSKLF